MHVNVEGALKYSISYHTMLRHGNADSKVVDLRKSKLDFALKRVPAPVQH